MSKSPVSNLFIASFIALMGFFFSNMDDSPNMEKSLLSYGYKRIIPIDTVWGSNFIEPKTGSVRSDLSSKLNPSIFTYKVIPGKVYLISGTRMAKYGMLAAWYDNETRIWEKIEVSNGRKKYYNCLPLIAPKTASLLKVQGTNECEAQLYEGDFQLQDTSGFKGHIIKVSDIINEHQEGHELNDNSVKSLTIFFDRIKNLQDLTWFPLKPIPNNQGEFEKSIPVTGMPYSSVKELQKYIGIDVSVYTFMTAVKDSNSLLYSQNTAQDHESYFGQEYHGVNCACFYGTVCNSFTAYCYGLKHNFITENYKNNLVSGFEIKKDQSILHLEVGDMWWNPGHVALISNIWKDTDNKLRLIELSESAGTHVHATVYTPWQLQERIQKNKAIFYIYTKFDEIANNVSSNHVGQFQGFPDLEICTWFGDKAAIADWDLIQLNFKQGNYNSILVFKDSKLVKTLDLLKSKNVSLTFTGQNPEIKTLTQTQNQIELCHEGPGFYQVYLANHDHLSLPTTFEIIDTSFSLEDKSNGTIVMFQSINGIPDIVYWVNQAGSQMGIPHIVSEKEVKQGFSIIERKPNENARIRVIYKGKYGRVINYPW